MKLISALLAASVGALVLPASVDASALQQCKTLHKRFSNLPSGTLLIKLKGQAWRVAENTEEGMKSRANTRFVYLLKGRPKHRGVLVIKSGSLPTVTAKKTVKQKTVKLIRTGYALDCKNKNVRSRKNSTVLYKTYRSYTDLDSKFGIGLGGDKLKKWHLNYVDRKGSCVATDDSSYRTADKKGVTNLSQFSFDPTVVRGGIPSIFARLFRSSFAATKLENLQVRLVKYSLYSGGFGCVQFRLSESSRKSVIRINDLEERNALSDERFGDRNWKLFDDRR